MNAKDGENCDNQGELTMRLTLEQLAALRDYWRDGVAPHDCHLLKQVEGIIESLSDTAQGIVSMPLHDPPTSTG